MWLDVVMIIADVAVIIVCGAVIVDILKKKRKK